MSVDELDMASFNVVCYQIADKNTYGEKFCNVLKDCQQKKKRIALKNFQASRIEKVEELDKDTVVFFLKKYTLANKSKFDLNLQQGDDYERVELTDNHFLASYNIGLYDKTQGVLIYNENNLATQSDIFFNLINSNETLEDDFIIFSVMLNTNINNIKSFKNIKFSYSNDYFINNHNNSKEVEALMSIASNFTLENATINIEIKSNKNGIIKKDEAKKLMQDTRLHSLTATYEDSENNKMCYNLISSILSYKDNIDNDKQKDFEACKIKIIEIHKKLFQK